ncbi:hypothetical protein [Flavobacterium sp.]|uniref:hypothetical protein n=1 Tax=Flavobacterium sp. TaxID=239 RepID=UPI0040345C93
MKIYSTLVKDSSLSIPQLLEKHGNLTPKTAKEVYDKTLSSSFKQIREDVIIVAETNYVDRVYRNSYYSYYGSKLRLFDRNCIKLSFFESSVNPEEDFVNPKKVDDVKGAYLGFIILRPTIPAVLGRSVLSPKALKANNFAVCTVSIASTAKSLRMKVVGFPHSSQDGETLKCAEVTIWAVMEYFGHKYSEYISVLPSTIIQTLKHVSQERQLPSKGLHIGQISYALREYGLGTKIYSRQEYDMVFDNILSCYIESGFPVVLSIDNYKYLHSPGANKQIPFIGHAVICIGRDRNIDENATASCPEYYMKRGMRQPAPDIEIYDFDDIRKQFVFIDDNCPAYQKAFLDRPTAHYQQSAWNTCEISGMVVPLHTRVYLEAFKVKSFVRELVTKSDYKFRADSKIMMRTYLAASRTYKQYIALLPNLPEKVRTIVNELLMPKFIWVTEWGAKDGLGKKKAEGIIILDSTEANTFDWRPLIFGIFQDKVVYFSQSEGNIQEFDISLQPFQIFEENLESIL